MKKSHALMLVAAAAAGSAAVVMIFLWIVGIVVSTVIIFSLVGLLIGWLKISSLRRDHLGEGASLSRLLQSTTSGKVIQQFKQEIEKTPA